ncbi:MAG: AtpZ/AtpI family protein [Bacteroidales bacterium]|jgi:F0F1-type ATP synthase assembly protein I|nr:AtpZ/AtpI family protein [Bacteroidales bacterium]MDD2570449.1 AtpZ/AtpI family protein [Bacteroidales bacterium]MDD2813210.1 AtpZ/AtpI family protein [Bacteroidales bacterium]MDD3384225.1 AtpZ/AtpI family protein [Bacteroidales bacterium]MDD3811015.1 AtpZ/AtpI family protein [Bacteroidales bacterium]
MEKQKKPPQQKDLDQAKKSLREYARYSNLAFKLIAVVLTAFFIGMLFDKWINTGYLIFTVIFSVGGLVLTLYLLIKDLLK